MRNISVKSVKFCVLLLFLLQADGVIAAAHMICEHAEHLPGHDCAVCQSLSFQKSHTIADVPIQAIEFTGQFVTELVRQRIYFQPIYTLLNKSPPEVLV